MRIFLSSRNNELYELKYQDLSTVLNTRDRIQELLALLLQVKTERSYCLLLAVTWHNKENKQRIAIDVSHPMLYGVFRHDRRPHVKGVLAAWDDLPIESRECVDMLQDRLNRI
jgi:hypothetical protein